MARQRVVSRTISSTEATVLALNANNALDTLTITVSGKHDTVTPALEKAVKKAMPETHSFAKITEVKSVEGLYSMPEVDFLKLATRQDAPAPAEKTEKKGGRK